MLGLLASNWGMPPVVVVNNNMGYYDQGGYNNYNQQNMYGDPNPDSAVGGFQQNNNIEMQDINSNNVNTGGNFGGYGNNDNNVGGFGGGNNFSNAEGDF